MSDWADIDLGAPIIRDQVLSPEPRSCISAIKRIHQLADLSVDCHELNKGTSGR